MSRGIEEAAEGRRKNRRARRGVEAGGVKTSQHAVSRILSVFAPWRERRRDDHSSSPAIAGGIKQPTRRRPPSASSRRRHSPRPWQRRSDGPSSTVSLFGFAPCGVLPAIAVTSDAVRSYRTFSPLPTETPGSKSPERRRAVCFLCHFPSSCPDRALPGALPCGVRTFLPPSRPPAASARQASIRISLSRRSARRTRTRTIVWRTATPYSRTRTRKARRVSRRSPA